MPFLNCVEHDDQNQLVQLILKLFADLKAVVFVSEVLRNFHVPWTQVAMDKQELVSELDHYLMTEIIHAAAEGLEAQCYWSKTAEGYRATAKSLDHWHHWLLQN